MKGKWGLSTPCFPISALPLQQPQGRLGCDPLRGELAIPGLDWSFAPSPRSGERIARQHPFGPPPGFRPASPCPGLDRSVSSLAAATPGPFGPRPSPRDKAPRLRACRFPYAFGVSGLKLAATANSPARVSRRTARPRSPGLVLPRRRGFLRPGSTLSSRARLSPPGFRLFSHPFRGSFQLSLTVLVRYRSRDVFSLGRWCLPTSRAKTKARYSGSRPFPTRLTPTGLSPSMAGHSRPLRLRRGGGGRSQ